MKKILLLFTFFSFFNLYSFAETDSVNATQVKADNSIQEDTSDEEPASKQTVNYLDEEQSLHQSLKQKFIEGGVGFMSVIVLCLILGLAIVIERIIYLNLATTNSRELLNKIDAAMEKGGIEAAKDVCRNTRGPLASIFYQGLSKSKEGLEIVEKSVISYGGVQMGLLERNLPWISLFISLAPMLGFLGTVIGMIDAFDAISEAGDVSPTLVADGIKVALITTVGGLIVAMILQVFYNYLLSKIDSIVNTMEDATISFIDILAKHRN